MILLSVYMFSIILVNKAMMVYKCYAHSTGIDMSLWLNDTCVLLNADM